jgi:hypothetical protein
MGFVGILRRSIRETVYMEESSLLCATEIGDGRKPCGKLDRRRVDIYSKFFTYSSIFLHPRELLLQNIDWKA